MPSFLSISLYTSSIIRKVNSRLAKWRACFEKFIKNNNLIPRFQLQRWRVVIFLTLADGFCEDHLILIWGILTFYMNFDLEWEQNSFHSKEFFFKYFDFNNTCKNEIHDNNGNTGFQNIDFTAFGLHGDQALALELTNKFLIIL